MQVGLALMLFLLVACGPSTARITGEPRPSPATTAPAVRATRSPAATPVPSSTPVPPQPHFREEFGDPLHYWSNWSASGALPSADILDGQLALTLQGPNTWWYSTFDAHEYADVRIDALVTFEDPAAGAAGILCRYSPESGWYEFSIAPDGLYSVLLGSWVAPQIARYVPIVYDETEYVEAGVSAVEIGLTCESQNLWLYVNGKLVRKLDVGRYGLTAGRLGLTASSFEDVPIRIRFDRLDVSVP